jgi:hypothetical protein
VQIHEDSDCGGIGHVIAEVPYFDVVTVNEDLLSCKPQDWKGKLETAFVG